MTPTFSPAPWHCGSNQVSCNNGATVALITHTSRHVPDGEVDANGRLIAAAPELFALCQQVVEYRQLLKQNYPDLVQLNSAVADMEWKLYSIINA